MKEQYTKREFLQRASMVGAGFLLTSCTQPSEAAAELSAPPISPSENELESPVPLKDPAPGAELTSTHVSFIRSGERQYETLRQGVNKRIQKRPKVIALCKDTRGVADAVKYAAQQRLPIAIKSGGHCFEGFSCNNDGLVVNLSRMRSVEWVDGTTVRVQPGCTLSELYDHLLPKRRLVPAGSCGGVGVGGLALGGGYGFFSRKYGLACDSLKEVTLVDGKGAIRSSKTDPELLWACRGGGNGNFGVVTEMVFQTHPAPASFTSHRFKTAHLTATRANSLLKHWFEVAGHLPETCFSAFVLNGNFLTILVTDYAAPTKPLQTALKELQGITGATKLGTPRPLASALKVFYSTSDPMYFKNSSAGSYHGYEDIRGCIGSVLEAIVSHPGMIFQVNTLGGKIAEPEFTRNSAYPHRSRPFLAELQAYWNVPRQESRLVETCRDIQQKLRKNGVTAHYVNYPSLDFDNWQQAYYGESYSRLQAVKRKYDPENNFRYEQSVRA